jgi:mannose-6-phosphate isomerase-like protein (cupin superfamily)
MMTLRPVLAGLVLFVLAAMPVPGAAHEEQKPGMANAATEMSGPFLFVLPHDAPRYTMIMGPPRTVTMRSGLVNLAPGKDVGLHSTEKNEEMLVILEGQGEVELEGFGRMRIAAGRTAYVPPKTRHNVFNTGTGPLKYIFVVSRAVE